MLECQGRSRYVAVPQEISLLLNVRHADMVQVTVVANEPIMFDPRRLAYAAILSVRRLQTALICRP